MRLKMKSFVYISCLLVYINAQDTSDLSSDGPADEVLDSLLKQVDVGEDEKERPCINLGKNCVRNWLHEHSNCKPVYGPVPDPLYRAQATQQLPRLNFTVTAINVPYTGLNGIIEEFYVNRKTDQVVLTVAFSDVSFQSNNSLYIFYRPAKEPVITKDDYSIIFSSLVVTATIPRINNLRYDRSEHFTFSNDPIPRFTIGKKAFSDKDPSVKKVSADLISELPMNVRETVLSEGIFAMASFMQYSLCDFGIEVI